MNGIQGRLARLEASAPMNEPITIIRSIVAPIHGPDGNVIGRKVIDEFTYTVGGDNPASTSSGHGT